MASSLKPTIYQTPSLRLLCHSCHQRFLFAPSHKRLLTTRDPKTRAHFTKTLIGDLEQINVPPSKDDFLRTASTALNKIQDKLGFTPRSPGSNSTAKKERPLGKFVDPDVEPPPHHLHVYATKHNCHITFTDGKLQPLISVSSGNIGFRKAARGSFEAAYQLGAYVMARIDKQGLASDIHAVEIILRDFGPGREAFQKILMAPDGKTIRDKVVRVMDATRLKFGGTRSKKPRRL